MSTRFWSTTPTTAFAGGSRPAGGKEPGYITHAAVDALDTHTMEWQTGLPALREARAGPAVVDRVRILAAPAVRRRAREHGIDLSTGVRDVTIRSVVSSDNYRQVTPPLPSSAPFPSFLSPHPSCGLVSNSFVLLYPYLSLN